MIGLRVWDKQGQLVEYLSSELLKIDGFIVVPKTHTGKGNITYTPPAGTKAVYFAVPMTGVGFDVFVKNINITPTQNGASYEFATLDDLLVSRATTVDYKIYYGYLNE